MKITKQNFLSYVEGWLTTSESFDDLSFGNMKAALHNSLAMIEDDQDGIIAELKRRKFYRDIS